MTQDQVEKFISQYLNQATRHNFENLKIKDFQSFDCEIEVEVAHTIHIKAIEDTSPEPKGELLTKGDYQNAIATITRDEQQNPVIIDKLKQHIDKCEYGNYYTQKQHISDTDNISLWVLDGLPQCFSYQTPCYRCGSKGFVSCDDCKGKGRTKCPNCSGRGQVKCSRCSGKGKTKKTKYENGKARTYFDECSACRGYGNIDCKKCDSHGILNCRKCDSSGVVDCWSCYTTGTITTNVEFAACVETEQLLKITSKNQAFDVGGILHNIPDNKLASYGECERLDLSKSELGVKERYKITLPIAQCTIEIDSKPFVWSLYGREIHIASNDHCVSYILQADVENLQKTARFCYLKPFILWQAKEPIKNLMDSPINKAILTANTKLFELLGGCEKYEQKKQNIIEMLKNENLDVSFEHFTNLMSSLLSIRLAYLFWSCLFWFVVAALLGVVCFEYHEQILEWVGSVWEGAPYVHYFILAPSLALLSGYVWRHLMIAMVWGKDFAQWISKRERTRFNTKNLGCIGLVWIVLEIGWHYLIN